MSHKRTENENGQKSAIQHFSDCIQTRLLWKRRNQTAHGTLELHCMLSWRVIYSIAGCQIANSCNTRFRPGSEQQESMKAVEFRQGGTCLSLAA